MRLLPLITLAGTPLAFVETTDADAPPSSRSDGSSNPPGPLSRNTLINKLYAYNLSPLANEFRKYLKTEGYPLIVERYKCPKLQPWDKQNKNWGLFFFNLRLKREKSKKLWARWYMCGNWIFFIIVFFVLAFDTIATTARKHICMFSATALQTLLYPVHVIASPLQLPVG